MIGWSWQDWLPHVIESIEQGEFEMRRYRSQVKPPEVKPFRVTTAVEVANEARRMGYMAHVHQITPHVSMVDVDGEGIHDAVEWQQFKERNSTK